MNPLFRGITALVLLAATHFGLCQAGDATGTRSAPPLDEPLVARPGLMIGRVMTWDGRPVPRFTIEYAAYTVGSDGVRLTDEAEPNAVAKVEGRDGYYEIRLPEGSYGLVSGVTLPLLEGSQTFRFWAETPGVTKLDFLEVEKGSPGVIKNFVWNLRSGGAAAFVASPNCGAALTIADVPELVKNVATRSLAAVYPARSRVVMTFTPRSRLIDGTEGRVLNKTVLLSDLGGSGATLRDIPFAVYEVSARLFLPEGTERVLRVASGPPDTSPDGVNRTFRWQPSALVDFVAAGSAMGRQERDGVRLYLGDVQ